MTSSLKKHCCSTVTALVCQKGQHSSCIPTLNPGLNPGTTQPARSLTYETQVLGPVTSFHASVSSSRGQTYFKILWNWVVSVKMLPNRTCEDGRGRPPIRWPTSVGSLNQNPGWRPFPYDEALSIGLTLVIQGLQCEAHKIKNTFEP